MSNTDSGINPAMLNELKELLGEKFEELIETYIDDASRRIELLKSAVPERDFTVIMSEAHGLKGSSRNIGANGFADYCAELERKGREEEWDVEQVFSAIEQQFAAVCGELKSFL